ncbi:MAG: winged helix-turn-helix transcriptional regulator [Rhodobacteraceae bacterium]|nr:winged helix-turn-helix transcriptional regulator [Paracoccaceae bacterium]
MTVLPTMEKSFATSEVINNEKLICDYLRAMAHEGRLMILNCLKDGEKSVLDLENLLPYRQAAISQQLARLRLEGFVDFRRDGKIRFYSIKNAKILRLVLFLNEEFSDI